MERSGREGIETLLRETDAVTDSDNTVRSGLPIRLAPWPPAAR